MRYNIVMLMVVLLYVQQCATQRVSVLVVSLPGPGKKWWYQKKEAQFPNAASSLPSE